MATATEEILVLSVKATDLKNVDGILGGQSKVKSKVLKRVNRLFGASDPFFEVLDSKDHLVARSEVVMNDLNPTFRPLHISMEKLCGGDLDQPIYLTFYDWEKSQDHQFMGHIKTTVRELQDKGKRYSAMGKKERKKNPSFELKVENLEFGNVFICETTVASGVPSELTDLDAIEDPTEENKSRRDSKTSITGSLSRAANRKSPSHRSTPQSPSKRKSTPRKETNQIAQKDGEGAEQGQRKSLSSFLENSSDSTRQLTVETQSQTSGDTMSVDESADRGITDATPRSNPSKPEDVFLLLLRATNVKNVDGVFGEQKNSRKSIHQKVDSFFGASDPFFEVANKQDRLVARSDIMLENLEPTFPPVAIPLKAVGKDPKTPIYLTFYDWEQNGKHKFMGHIKTSLHDLREASAAYQNSQGSPTHSFDMVVDRKIYGSVYVCDTSFATAEPTGKDFRFRKQGTDLADKLTNVVPPSSAIDEVQQGSVASRQISVSSPGQSDQESTITADKVKRAKVMASTERGISPNAIKPRQIAAVAIEKGETDADDVLSTDDETSAPAAIDSLSRQASGKTLSRATSRNMSKNAIASTSRDLHSIADTSSQAKTPVDVLTLQLKAKDMKNVDGVLGTTSDSRNVLRKVDRFFGSSDPFFEVLNSDGQVVARSEVVTNSLNPEFQPLRISLDALCGGNLEAPVVLSFYDWDESGRNKSTFMGEVKTSVKDLLDAKKKYSSKKGGIFGRSTPDPSWELFVNDVMYGKVYVAGASLGVGVPSHFRTKSSGVHPTIGTAPTASRELPNVEKVMPQAAEADEATNEKGAQDTAKFAAEQEAKHKAAEEAAKLTAEEQARKNAEEAARVEAEEQGRRKAEEAARLASEKEAAWKAQAARLAAEEAGRKASEEAARSKAAEEAAKLSIERVKRWKAEAARLAALEEAKRMSKEASALAAKEDTIQKTEAAESEQRSHENGASWLSRGFQPLMGSNSASTQMNSEDTSTTRSLNFETNQGSIKHEPEKSVGREIDALPQDKVQTIPPTIPNSEIKSTVRSSDVISADASPKVTEVMRLSIRCKDLNHAEDVFSPESVKQTKSKALVRFVELSNTEDEVVSRSIAGGTQDCLDFGSLDIALDRLCRSSRDVPFYISFYASKDRLVGRIRTTVNEMQGKVSDQSSPAFLLPSKHTKTGKVIVAGASIQTGVPTPAVDVPLSFVEANECVAMGSKTRRCTIPSPWLPRILRYVVVPLCYPRPS